MEIGFDPQVKRCLQPIYGGHYCYKHEGHVPNNCGKDPKHIHSAACSHQCNCKGDPIQ